MQALVSFMTVQFTQYRSQRTRLSLSGMTQLAFFIAPIVEDAGKTAAEGLIRRGKPA
jgi:hypothetical protein